MVWSAGAQSTVTQSDTATDSLTDPQTVAQKVASEDCERLIPQAWPATEQLRKITIRKLDSLHAKCINSARFLAAFGALLLEDGEARQALFWLERSLLLEPENLGAQIDHALALAELGEPAALTELAMAWRDRVDLPQMLRKRMFQGEGPSASGSVLARAGQAIASNWGVLREVSLLTGYESNLDQSPRLSELTLTVPGGSLVLPVTSQPRSGGVVLGAATLQGALSASNSVILRSGFSLSARAAPSQPQTDWHQFSWATTAVVHQAQWRAQTEATVSYAGGALSEPYRLLRLGASFESLLADCRVRAAADTERRQQSQTRSFDSSRTSAQGSIQCPVPGFVDWTGSLLVQAARDKPDGDMRPGGEQRQWLGGVRVFGRVGLYRRLEASLRLSNSKDELGYSPLLANGQPRQVQLTQLAVEFSQGLQTIGWVGAEGVLQWQSARQSSNLPLFDYKANRLYAGLRWSW